MNKFYKQKLAEIEQMKQDAFKQIDECPFILHQKGLFWRLSAWLCGVKNPLSQAEYLKRDVEFQYEILKIELMQSMIGQSK